MKHGKKVVESKGGTQVSITTLTRQMSSLPGTHSASAESTIPWGYKSQWNDSGPQKRSMVKGSSKLEVSIHFSTVAALTCAFFLCKRNKSKRNDQQLRVKPFSPTLYVATMLF